MPSDFNMNDPQNIWQSQTTEEFKMSADQLRLKAQKRERKSRFEAAYSIVIGLVLFVFFALGSARTQALDPRVGFGVLSLWSLYFAYKSWRRIWRSRLKLDSTLDITIRSYRTELEKRHDFTGRVWLTLAPAFLGMTLVVVPVLIRSLQVPRNLLNLAPFLVLLAIWFAIFIPKRKRDQQKLEQEIERLRAFEREYRP